MHPTLSNTIPTIRYSFFARSRTNPVIARIIPRTAGARIRIENDMACFTLDQLLDQPFSLRQEPRPPSEILDSPCRVHPQMPVNHRKHVLGSIRRISGRLSLRVRFANYLPHTQTTSHQYAHEFAPVIAACGLADGQSQILHRFSQFLKGLERRSRRRSVFK